jgi:glycosyltransferase involved in cell wall biosynthesis
MNPDKETVFFSVVIPVYNDWRALQECLRSLASQANPPGFEVIVVDDGSAEPAPEFIRDFTRRYPLTFVQQSHAGIPKARNLGIKSSRGEILLFVDADCKVEVNCLATLSSAIVHSPEDDYFQLRLVGSSDNLVRRTERLRLSTFQEFMLQPGGHIRYLNTAGFAIRRSKANIETGVFDPDAVRGEDTLLLVELMQAGKLPLFVPDAIVEHSIPLSVIGCLRKDVRSAFTEKRTYDVIASKQIRIRLTHTERLRLLRSVWKASENRSIGRSAFFFLLLKQTVRRLISFGPKVRVLASRQGVKPP